jgi:predicted dehydrogenase
MNIFLIGFGYWGKNLARVINQNKNCRLYGIAETDPEKLKAALEVYPGILSCASYKDVLQLKNIDAVVIATPVKTQLQLVKTFLSAGKHVLCEKVLSTNPESIKKVIQLANENKVMLMVGYTFLFNSVVRDIKKRIESGDLGAIYYSTFKRTGLGPIRDDVDVIEDLAVHDISIALFWFGMPDWVKCVKRDVLKKGKADVAFLQLGYENGLIINIQVSWINPMKQRLVEVVGEKKMVVFDDVSTSEKLKIINAGKDYYSVAGDFGSFQFSLKDGDIIIPNLNYKEPLSEELAYFVNKIRKADFTDDYRHITLQVAEILAKI